MTEQEKMAEITYHRAKLIENLRKLSKQERRDKITHVLRLRREFGPGFIFFVNENADVTEIIRAPSDDSDPQPSESSVAHPRQG